MAATQSAISSLPSRVASPSAVLTETTPSLTPVTPYPPSLTPITPTLGPRSIWPPSINFSYQEEQTKQGVLLSLSRKNPDVTYQLGPLAEGEYAVGPNDRYLVYMTDYGQLMAIRLGQTTFVKVKNMAREYTAIHMKINPSFSFAFYDSGISVTVIVTESHYEQSIPVKLPRSVTYD